MAYDAIIVGARCAGAPTAMLLARRGYKILLLDANRVPSDMPMSTHLIWQSGAAHLHRWGLLDRIAGSNCPPIRRCEVDLGPIRLVGEPPRGGNPNLYKGMGYSNNPGGRRKYDKGAKELMGEHTVEAVQFWIAIMRDPDEDMSHRMRASENIAWGFLGKPSQQVFAAHAHVKLDELPADTSELNRLAAGYAAMIGAEPGSMPPMIDVTPSDSRTSRTVSPRDDKAWIDELRQMAADEEAEQARPQTRLERLQRRQQQQPREPAPRSQRIVRRRRD